MRFAIVIEKSANNYSAYVLDLPGCVATGGSAEEAKHNIAEAIRFHVEGLSEDGFDVPVPSSVVEYTAA